MKNWTYREGSTPHFQGLVYCEETGEDIAVTYHDESGEKARLIAACPKLLEALQELAKEVELSCSIGSDPRLMELLQKWMKAKDAINKATQP